MWYFVITYIVFLFSFGAGSSYAYEPPSYPFAPAAGESGTTAVSLNDSRIVAWADGYQDVSYGDGVSDIWKTPEKALGQAKASSYDIVSLGRGGSIVMTFSQDICNGDGDDFAVFENAFDDEFLELSWIEVSSDGIHFVRFPNYCYWPSAVGASGELLTTYIYGYGGKYRQGYGTPFDLAVLQEAYEDPSSFSEDYRSDLLSQFPYLDLNHVGYVRIADIVGDGNAKDCEGYTIYDPYPTSISAGFDLDAVAVFNQVPVDGLEQSINFPEIENQCLSIGGITLEASSSSGLPVTYTILEGNATLQGNVLTWSEEGQIVVQASQEGDDTYAAASPVVRSFYVAEQTQYIFVEPLCNQLVGALAVPFVSRTSSGLKPEVEVMSGPSSVLVYSESQTLDCGDETGEVVLRVYQSGNESYAPAEDQYIYFKICEADDSEAPVDFDTWASENGSLLATGDEDGDGFNNQVEYQFGSDPLDSESRPVWQLSGGDSGVINLKYSFNRSAKGRSIPQESIDLINWEIATPRVSSLYLDEDRSMLIVEYQWDVDSSNACFLRVQAKDF